MPRDQAAVKSATADDVQALVRLINAAYEVERFFKTGARTDVEGVRRLMGRGTFLVTTERDGQLSGCVFVEIREDGRGYFGLLAVDPPRQGQGLARRLVEAAEGYCRAHGCKVLDLHVVNLRTELPPFYRRLGYTESGTEAYSDRDATVPCHFVVMTKDLS